MRRFAVLSFPRSGKHWLERIIVKNFGIKSIDIAGRIHGCNMEDIKIDFPRSKFYDKHEVIYIIRDPRDVMCSSYNFFLHPKKRKNFIKIENCSMSEFIRGEADARHRELKHLNKLLASPVKYWVSHLEWIDSYLKPYVIRFEDLKYDFENTMFKFSNYFNINKNKFKNTNKLQGKITRKGRSGGWRKRLHKEDLKYIYEIALRDMLKFGYDEE